MKTVVALYKWETDICRGEINTPRPYKYKWQNRDMEFKYT